MTKYKEQLENCKKCKSWPGHPCKECDIVETVHNLTRELNIVNYAFTSALAPFADYNTNKINALVEQAIAYAKKEFSNPWATQEAYTVEPEGSSDDECDYA